MGGASAGFSDSCASDDDDSALWESWKAATGAAAGELRLRMHSKLAIVIWPLLERCVCWRFQHEKGCARTQGEANRGDSACGSRGGRGRERVAAAAKARHQTAQRLPTPRFRPPRVNAIRLRFYGWALQVALAPRPSPRRAAAGCLSANGLLFSSLTARICRQGRSWGSRSKRLAAFKWLQTR